MRIKEMHEEKERIGKYAAENLVEYGDAVFSTRYNDAHASKKYTGGYERHLRNEFEVLHG